MSSRSLLVSAVSLAFLAIGSSVAAGSGDVAAKKQRIAIEGVFNLGTQTGTFKLIPLTPGPLKKDSGTFKARSSGLPVDPTVRVINGQSITVGFGGDELTGKNGTFSLSLRIDVVSAGGVYQAVTGTWTFDRGTGVYAGLTGGGGYGAVVLPGGKSPFREEGIVRAG